MTENKNPFLKPYNTPHDTAPFHLIKIEHYEPALLEGMKEQNEEIDAIVNNPEAPTFQNTIVALEKSGALLDRVTTVFGNLMSAETSDEMQELAEKMMPVLSEHSNNISLNEKLFARIKAVYEQKDQLQLMRIPSPYSRKKESSTRKSPLLFGRIFSRKEERNIR